MLESSLTNYLNWGSVYLPSIVNGTRLIDRRNAEDDGRYSKWKGKNVKVLNAKKEKNAGKNDEGIQLGTNEWKLIQD